MTASSSHTKLFHYLLRRQRSVDIQHTQILQYNDQVAETHEDILALWQKYFQDLSNPDFKQDFWLRKIRFVTYTECHYRKEWKRKIELIKEEEIELKAKKITRYWWHISRALQKCNRWVKTTDIAHTKYNNRGARYPTNAKKRYNDTSTKEK